MRELSMFDQREVRRLVAMHIYRKEGLYAVADALEPAKVDRELYLAAWELADTVRSLCTP